jgi:hypothetical protein
MGVLKLRVLSNDNTIAVRGNFTMLDRSHAHEKQVYRKNEDSNQSKNTLTEVRNGGKLMCRVSMDEKKVEIIKDKGKKTVITFNQDCTVIENHDGTDLSAIN